MFKGPIEADLVDAVGDPQPSNRRRAIRLWHPCVDVYISNPQTTVVARSDHHGAGRKPGCAVAESHARARGASAFTDQFGRSGKPLVGIAHVIKADMRLIASADMASDARRIRTLQET
jgi:hypothetical protein